MDGSIGSTSACGSKHPSSNFKLKTQGREMLGDQMRLKYKFKRFFFNSSLHWPISHLICALFIQWNITVESKQRGVIVSRKVAIKAPLDGGDKTMLRYLQQFKAFNLIYLHVLRSYYSPSPGFELGLLDPQANLLPIQQSLYVYKW